MATFKEFKKATVLLLEIAHNGAMTAGDLVEWKNEFDAQPEESRKFALEVLEHGISNMGRSQWATCRGLPPYSFTAKVSIDARAKQ